MKKKKWLWMGIISVVAVLGVIFLPNYLGKPAEDEPIVEEDPYGIEYYTVPAIEQIFVKVSLRLNNLRNSIKKKT